MLQKSVDTVRVLKWLIAIVLGFSLTMAAFATGIWVGEKRAEFSFRWADNYHRNFGGPRKGFLGDFPQTDFINGHGVFGPVIKIDGNVLVVKDQDQMEKTIIVSNITVIKNKMATGKLADIKVFDVVVVIGSPDANGNIRAELVRVMPPAN